MVIYTVSPGDSMYSIAKKYGVTLSDLERFNRLPDNTRLAVGEDILIPKGHGARCEKAATRSTA